MIRSTEDHGAIDCATRGRIYRHGALEVRDPNEEALRKWSADPDAVLWFDLLAPTTADLSRVAEILGGRELHPLALEGALSHGRRPRFVRFGDHFLVHTRSLRLDAEDSIQETEIGMFVTSNALITIRSNEAFALNTILDGWDDESAMIAHGVGYLVWSFLDAVMDGYFAVVDSLDEDVQSIEDALIDEGLPVRDIQLRNFVVRRSVVAASRVVLPMAEVCAGLLRPNRHPIDNEVTPYYQDLYDHSLRLTERVDGLRDAIEIILSTGLAMQGNSLNEVMKKLTAWAAIIAIPTGVTGYFGQNIPFPGYDRALGFWLSTVLLIGLATGLWWSFKRRDWL
ncbi:magnesium transporter [Rhodococcus sp. PAMC28707]|uniref:magnesium transporter CorA family protein n=1 Tax=unclassified Rhodococcus (in: high G+C Gram-positive bacteria) TaxID=192944 RepID=UPI00109DF06A|nr:MULTISPECIES: magnesium transporter CorA family protein [unclassified Rhodococcus (in: high G+C Gram-positive bacteria)]QCB50154.1 magnesium transporter [Rhodococcus sp. PAMC28705]QCB58153.1 magnesium transporter [Rhodococcus sp. PAMC28707]